MSVLHINNITNKEGTGGPTIAGITTVDSTGFMRVPVGDTRKRTYIPPTDNIVTDGLVLHLDAGRPESYTDGETTWRDLSGNNNNGTLENGVGFTVDDGGSLEFDGVNDYVSISNASSLQVDNFTLEAWVYPINNSESGHIIRKEGSYILSHYWSAESKMGVWVQRTGGWESTHADITVPLNQWAHIVGTYDNSNVRIYYNANQVASTSKSGAIRVTTNSVLVNGVVSNSLPQNYNSSIVKIYNRALTATEVQQNYNALVGRYS
jgi:hypothetical protein